MKSRWSIKYKRSINCSSPKGFSQKNYCKRQKRGGKYKSFKEWLNEIQPQNEPTIQSKDNGNMIEVSYNEPNVQGYLHAEQDTKNPKLYRVKRVTVTPQGQGYGKKLYIAAMKLATQKGAMLTSANNSTSDSAINVWKSLYKDPNIQKIPLSSNDWPESPRNQKMMQKYPSLRYKDPSTYPPQNDKEFWAFNSGYKIL